MKKTVNKCEFCNEMFEKNNYYNVHIKNHKILHALETIFPTEKDEHCNFANGGYSIQRSEKWLNQYKKVLKKIIKITKYKPFSYGWFRTLDDGDSMFYSAALRVTNICPKCYREYGQPYYAINCTHKDKIK